MAPNKPIEAGAGLPVWADDRIDFGDPWWRTIVANIRSSVAMVVVMTPAAEESKWVEREILLADKIESNGMSLVAIGEHPAPAAQCRRSAADGSGA